VRSVRRAVFWVLLALGAFWLAFVVLSHGNDEGWRALLFEAALVPGPFFLLAFAGRKWPRLAGIALLVAAVVAFFFFDVGDAFAGESGAQLVALVLVAPMALCGALLASTPRRRRSPRTP